MSDDYAPFPAEELEAIAQYHDAVAALWSGNIASRHIARAKACRDAIASYEALQMRMLEDETEKRLRFAGYREAAD